MKTSMAAGVILALACASSGWAQASAARGKALFVRCARCHSLGPDKAATGPDLKGVVGRKAGKAPGFEYSGAMRHSGLIWDASTLNAFLAEPRVLVPRSSMPNQEGVEDAQDRQDLIAYLKRAGRR